MTTLCQTPPTKPPTRSAAPVPAPLREKSTTLHGLHAIADQTLVSATSFATGLLVGQVSKAQLGTYALGISTFWLVAGVTNALVWTPYTARAAHLGVRRHRQYRALSAALSFAIGAVLAVGLGLCGILADWWLPADSWLAPFLWACVPLAVTMTIREHVRRVFVADFNGWQLLAIDIPICLLTLVSVASLLWLGQLDANTALVATALAAMPAMLIAYRHLSTDRIGTDRLLATFRSNWQYGKWLLLVAITWLASDSALRWLLVWLGGRDELGSFAGVFLIVAMVNPLLLAMTSFARSVASRTLASGQRHQLTQGALQSTRWSVAFATLAFVALTLFGNSLTAVTFGETYVDPWLMTMLALAVCLEGVAVPIEATFIALEYGKLLSWVASARLVVSLVLGAALIPFYGAHGLAMAMVGRSVVVFAMYVARLVATHRQFAEDLVATPAAGNYPCPEASAN